MIPKSLIYTLLILAFIGFIDASYLTAVHYSNIALPCFITQGCDSVTTSVYSKIFGLPVSAWGVLYYLLVFGLVIYFVDKQERVVLKFLHLITSLGFLMTLWFLYVQAFLLHSWCMYCLLSAFTSTALFILSALAFHKKWA